MASSAIVDKTAQVPGLLAEVTSANYLDAAGPVAYSKVVETGGLNKYWGEGSLYDVDYDNVKITYTGFFVPQQTGSYHFSGVVDDGFRLSIDNQVLINAYRTGSSRVYDASKNVVLQKDVLYPVKIEYLEGRGSAQMQVAFSVDDGPAQVAGSNFFYRNADQPYITQSNLNVYKSAQDAAIKTVNNTLTTLATKAEVQATDSKLQQNIDNTAATAHSETVAVGTKAANDLAQASKDIKADTAGKVDASADQITKYIDSKAATLSAATNTIASDLRHTQEDLSSDILKVSDAVESSTARFGKALDEKEAKHASEVSTIKASLRDVESTLERSIDAVAQDLDQQEAAVGNALKGLASNISDVAKASGEADRLLGSHISDVSQSVQTVSAALSSDISTLADAFSKQSESLAHSISQVSDALELSVEQLDTDIDTVAKELADSSSQLAQNLIDVRSDLQSTTTELVAKIETQESTINATIADLAQNTESEIGDLRESSFEADAQLATNIGDLTGRVDSLEADLRQNLETTRSTLQETIDRGDDALTSAIFGVNNDVKAVNEYLETVATVDQLAAAENEFNADIVSVQADIEAAVTQAAADDNDLNGRIDAVAHASKAADDALSKALSNVTETLTSTIQEVTVDLANSIAGVQQNHDEFVNDVTKVIAEDESAIQANVSAISALASEVTSAEQAIDEKILSTKNELTDAVRQASEKADASLIATKAELTQNIVQFSDAAATADEQLQGEIIAAVQTQSSFSEETAKNFESAKDAIITLSNVFTAGREELNAAITSVANNVSSVKNQVDTLADDVIEAETEIGKSFEQVAAGLEGLGAAEEVLGKSIEAVATELDDVTADYLKSTEELKAEVAELHASDELTAEELIEIGSVETGLAEKDVLLATAIQDLQALEKEDFVGLTKLIASINDGLQAELDNTRGALEADLTSAEGSFNDKIADIIESIEEKETALKTEITSSHEELTGVDDDLYALLQRFGASGTQTYGILDVLGQRTAGVTARVESREEQYDIPVDSEEEGDYYDDLAAQLDN
mmetsp:Transcript_34951/g.56563  ORF Transcript_34951/g.56563 Transcript_34951/m.56563 type:complete len:1045 (-) Transcript_34951:314-3448(-)